MTIRGFLSDLTPPAVSRALIRRAPGQLRFVDGFDSWEQATAAAGGYDEGSILEVVRRATDEVVAGRAAFERDGVTFERLDIRWPVAGAMMWQAARHGGRLAALDFGGSLGSSYRQLGPLRDGIDVQWGVVEQEGFVTAGHAYEDGSLRFFPTIQACVEAISPTIALLSGVLPYLPDPHAVVREIASSGVEAILIDRTPVQDSGADVPVLQQVPATIYEASYAAWILDEGRLLADLPGWTLLHTFPSFEEQRETTTRRPFSWQGYLFTRSSR